MTPSRALQILYSVWGSHENLGPTDSAELESVELPGETALHTVCRIAGIPFHLVSIPQTDWQEIRRLIVAREIQLACERSSEWLLRSKGDAK